MGSAVHHGHRRLGDTLPGLLLHLAPHPEVETVNRSLLRRETLETYRPFSRYNFLFGAGNGRVLPIETWAGFDESTICLIYPQNPRTIPRRNSRVAPDSKSGLKTAFSPYKDSRVGLPNWELRLGYGQGHDCRV
jgi:hypothetical protein